MTHDPDDTRIFNMTESEKAAEIGMSASFLRKDRMKAVPVIPFRKYGGAIRYAAGPDPVTAGAVSVAAE